MDFPTKLSIILGILSIILGILSIILSIILAVYREEKSGKRYTGAALMYGGMPLPIEPGEYQAYQYCFVKE